MGGNTTEVIGAAAAGALAVLLLVGLVVLARKRRHRRSDLEAALEASRVEAAELRAQLDALTRRRVAAPVADNPRRRRRQETPEFLITDAGMTPTVLGEDGNPVEPVVVPDRIVLSATFGAPLVKVAAFGHGVRRALSPENRNRIGFEMRREVRASRKRRRALLKEYQRNIRAEDRAREGLA